LRKFQPKSGWQVATGGLLASFVARPLLLLAKLTSELVCIVMFAAAKVFLP